MSTIEQVIDMVMEVLGLAKSLPISGAGTIEYVIEEMWTDGSRESKIQSFLFQLTRNLPERIIDFAIWFCAV